MKRFRFSLVLLFLLVGLCRAGDEARISNALGMTLGKKYEPKEGVVIQREQDGSELYPYKPDKVRKPFTEYLVEITPTTKVISQIWAGAVFAEKADAAKERDTLLTALEEKYGRRVGQGDRLAGIAEMFEGAVIKDGERYIMVVIMPKDNQYRLLLQYVDQRLKTLAKDERIKVTRGEREDPGEGPL